MSNTPSDEDIVALAISDGIKVRTGAGAVRLVRAALAKWGTPQPTAAEFALQALIAAGHVSQELVDKALALPGAPQPVVQEPLTPSQYNMALGCATDIPPSKYEAVTRAIERAHGITQRGGSNGL